MYIIDILEIYFRNLRTLLFFHHSELTPREIDKITPYFQYIQPWDS